MKVEILGAESMGVRSLCCRVSVGERVIVIDPGVALGLWRYGLPPHPVQIAPGRTVRQCIVRALEGATDVVFSHFHGDHVPLKAANPYQLAFGQLPPNFAALRGWCLSPQGQTRNSHERANDLMALMGSRLRVAEGLCDGPLCFSCAVPHGIGGLPFGSVMLTRVNVDGRVFVHASDIQLLTEAAVDLIVAWAPDWVLAAGPAIYHKGTDAGRLAWRNGIRLAEGVGTLILDHHLMRSPEGAEWLQSLSRAAGKRIFCAADFMGRPRRLLEAYRRELYRDMPVRAGWHRDYVNGFARIDDFAPAASAAEVL